MPSIAIYGRGPARMIATGTWIFLLSVGCRVKTADHLSRASSPYLRGQAGDPVDWYEWGSEALAKAKKEDKPLIISVGYSACHWCHVMEKETFRDIAVAKLMNDSFVCIKVDREERPDIDNVYSLACQLIAGRSGWPLNAFALPDGKPFFAGTYYSKQSWLNLLGQILNAYRSQRNKVELQARTLANGIADPGILSGAGADSAAGQGKDGATGVVDKSSYRRLFGELYRKIDLSNGGLEGTPKFPNPPVLEFFLQYYFAERDKRALDVATNTLTKMALGGICDQLGGGFTRYATDSLWHIPHFEKMLCDNAQLLSVYAHAYQVTHDDLFKDMVRGIIGFTERDLGRPNGGYFSSVDADSRSGEGEYYAWNVEELKKDLPDDYGLVSDYYQITQEGNWKQDRNILFATETPAGFAKARHIDPAKLSGRLGAAKHRLLLERDKRGKPAVDEKILTSWNALLLHGYLDAYAAIGDREYLHYALKIADFFERNMLQKDGGLFHVFQDGKASVDGFADDYALLAEAYLRLYELTFSKHWLDLAKRLGDHALAGFFDPAEGMFFYTSADRSDRRQLSDDAVIRRIEIADNNIPSSNAVMAEVLYRLGHYFENEDYLEKAAHMMSRMGGPLVRDGALYYARWACLAGLFVDNVNEVAIVGKEALTKGLALQKNYLPFCLFMGSTGEENLPLLDGKKQDPQTLIYVCTDKVCKKPVADTAAAQEQLGHKPWR